MEVAALSGKCCRSIEFYRNLVKTYIDQVRKSRICWGVGFGIESHDCRYGLWGYELTFSVGLRS